MKNWIRALVAAQIVALLAMVCAPQTYVVMTQDAHGQSAQFGGGPRKVDHTGSTAFSGDGTTGSKLTATLQKDSTITGTGSAGAPFATSGLGSLTFAAFGDCSDGNGTIPAGTSTATRDLFYNDLTIQTGGILATNGFRIFVCGTLTFQGTGKFSGSGANGVNGGVGGAGGPAGSVGVGGNGGNGQTGAGLGGGASATATPECSGLCNGGAGGAGASGAGGAAGTLTVSSVNSGSVRYERIAVMGHVRATVTAISAGSGGGGGGGGGASAVGGGGGGGGRYVMVAAKVISGAGTIESSGGNGGNGGTGGTGNTGGGGGGGGGTVVLIYGTGTLPTLTANGGTGGTKNGTGVNGTNGGAGVTFSFKIGS